MRTALGSVFRVMGSVFRLTVRVELIIIAFGDGLGLVFGVRVRVMGSLVIALLYSLCIHTVEHFN